MSDVPQLIGRRAVVACLVLAPSCEVVEALLSPLRGGSTHADLVAIQGHQGAFVASVVVGLLGTLLYLPAYLGLASLTSSRSPRLAVAGGLLCGVGMLAFGAVRMVSALELQAVREPVGLATAAEAVDGLASSQVMGPVLGVFLLGTALGYPLLAASSWRAGLARPAAVCWGCVPFVAFFVDDGYWGNILTHVALLGSLAWIARSLASADLRPRPLLPRRFVGVAMVVAPTFGILELVLSPLATTSTRADVEAAAGNPHVFVASLLVGTAATLLYVPALVGFAGYCVARSPIAARVGAAGVLVCMTGFMGIRAVQAFEPAAVRHGLTSATTARLVDHLSANPVGALVLVMFLGGSAVGLVGVAVAAWRSGFSRVPAVLLGMFPFADLVAPGRIATIGTHVLLLAALTWLARDLVQTTMPRPAERPAVVQPARG